MSIGKSILALLCALVMVGCTNSSSPTTTTTGTPTPAVSATAAQTSREVKPTTAIELKFTIGEKTTEVEVPGLMVQVTDSDNDFFRFDFFVNLDALVKIAKACGKEASYSSETKILTVGDEEYKQTDVPAIGKGMDGSMAGFGSEGVDTYIQDGKPYFRISSIGKGLGCNSLSRMSNGYTFSGPG